MREICMSGSMSGVWRRSHGRTSEAPPNERGGNRYVRPTATAPHLDSTTSSGLIMSRLGQVSLTKPTYRRIVLRCCSVPQAKPSPDYEYRISLRPHPVGHPSSSTRDSASRAVPSSIRVRRDGYREAREWQQAGGDQRGRAAQKVFA